MIFGEVGLICDSVWTADVQTEGFTVVSYITRPQFEQLAEINKEVMYGLKHQMNLYKDPNFTFMAKVIKNCDIF